MPRGMGVSNSNAGRKRLSAPSQIAAQAEQLTSGIVERLRRAYHQIPEAERPTQVALAKAAGVSQSLINGIVNGQQKPNITAAVVVKLCLAMSIDYEFVLVGKGDIIPKMARESEASQTPAVDLRADLAPVAAPNLPHPEPAAQPEPAPTPAQRASKRASRNPPSP